VIDTTLALFNKDQFINALAADMQISANRVIINEIKEILPPFCPGCITKEVLFPNYLIPAQVTTYVSFGLQLPVDAFRHIIRIEPIIDNAQYLHHIVVFIAGGTVASNNNPIVENMPSGARPLYAWAPGAGDYYDLPPEAGFNVASDPAQDYYLVLSSHYNNPTQVSGQRDSSGMRVYLDTPRANNATFLFFGLVGEINIPANSDLYRQGSYFTIPLIPGNPDLHVFSSFPHMHSRGQQIWLERMRNNIFDAEYGRVDSWDYNSQRIYPENSIIKQGDILYTSCLFNTVGELNTIYGGEATYQEMCLVGLGFYPNVVPPGWLIAPYDALLSGRNNCSYPCNFP